MLADAEVLAALLRVFRALLAHDLPRQREVLAALPEPARSAYRQLLPAPPPGARAPERGPRRPLARSPEDVLLQTLGFSVARAASSLVSAGRGVFVTRGLAPRGAVVSMYPGNAPLAPGRDAPIDIRPKTHPACNPHRENLPWKLGFPRVFKSRFGN